MLSDPDDQAESEGTLVAAPGANNLSEHARRFRFAPSPNGMLHLGHAYSGLMNDLLAKKTRGTMLLRLEDIDQARCRPEFEKTILDDLGWLGIRWSPQVWRQSERFDDYRAALKTLEQMGLLYPCFCTRGDIAKAIGTASHWPQDPDGSPLYPGTCRLRGRADTDRMVATGAPAALRLDMNKALALNPIPFGWTDYRELDTSVRITADPKEWGDVLLARRDIPTSYHVSVVVDDAAQGITDVVRGADLFQATSLHRLLQRLLSLPEPVYHHHRLILDHAGEKLSKSRNAPTLQALRQSGKRAEDIRHRLGFGPVLDP